MDRFEMGGYLPLELHRGQSWFADLPAEQRLEVNTGRTALYYAIESLGVKHVYAPSYYCPDIIAMLERMDVQVEYYRIGEDLLPLDLPNRADSAVILVNYFGVMGSKLRAFAQGYDRVIFDQAHGFFTPPVMEDGVMNVYSCRKFLGVSDGAYLIGTRIAKPELPQDVSSPRASHLFTSLELGTNAAYGDNKRNEEALGASRLGMSELTRQILEGADYEQVAERRRRNYRYLHRRLERLQLLELPEEDPVAYAYPLLLPRDIHRALVQRRIYVPVLWSQLLEPSWDGTLEQRYSANIVPLPLDQRYDEADMERMAQIVEECLRETAGGQL